MKESIKGFLRSWRPRARGREFEFFRQKSCQNFHSRLCCWVGGVVAWLKSLQSLKNHNLIFACFAFQVFQINLCSCIIVSTLCDICCEVLEYFVFSSPIFRPIMNIRPPHLKNEATLFLFGSVAFMVQACKTMMIAFKTDINKHAYKHTLWFEKIARKISPFNLTNFFWSFQNNY